MINKNPQGYGVFLQDGGQMGMDMSTDQQMSVEQPVQDPQAIAQEFLDAFAQIPPEAQQLIMQTLNQPV